VHWVKSFVLKVFLMVAAKVNAKAEGTCMPAPDKKCRRYRRFCRPGISPEPQRLRATDLVN
jgi:hypothetical protein